MLPVDDDDWFAPDVGATLLAHDAPGLLGIHWRASFLEIPMHFRHELGMFWRSFLDDPPLPYVFTTNNHAIRRRENLRRYTANHVRASAWMRSLDPTLFLRIPRRLSLMNRTLASQTSLVSLSRLAPRASLLRKYRRYRTLYRRPLAPGLEWSAPEVARMDALMAELSPRSPVER